MSLGSPFQPPVGAITSEYQLPYPTYPPLAQKTSVKQTSSCIHCYSFSTGWRLVLRLPVPCRNLAVKVLSCWGSNPVFCFKQGVRERDRGEGGSWTCLHSLTTCRPSPSFTNRRDACLSGLQETLEDCLQQPTSSSSHSGFGSHNLIFMTSSAFYHLHICRWKSPKVLLSSDVRWGQHCPHHRVAMEAMDTTDICSFPLKSQNPL